MKLTRRKFLIGSGIVGGGLILGFSLSEEPAVPGTIAGSFQPNAWLQITSDGRVIYQLHKVEMGQGVMTALPTLMAEELDMDPAHFEIAMAGVHPAFKGSPPILQITGGSNSVASSWDTLREAGAAARAMLIAAAADRWKIPVTQCLTDDGTIINSVTQQRLSYAEVAQDAAEFTDVSFQLKSPQQYRWIGKDYPRLDLVSKSDGTAQFGIDVALPNLKTAVVVRCPYYGGKIQDWNVDSIIDHQGVIATFPIHSGIAIVADTYWQARKAANALHVTWDKGPLAGVDNDKIVKDQQLAMVEKSPRIAFENGDIESLSIKSSSLVSARYSAPFTHHSPMEPQNATALYTESEDGAQHCEVWAPNQAPDICRALTAHFGKLPHQQIRIHTTLMGGGFGRRGYPDYVGEVAAIARELPDTPVKLIWSREDDMQHDFYRPASLHQLEGSLDDNGQIQSWRHNVVSASIIRGFAVEMMSVALPTWVPTEMARSLGKTAGKWLAGADPIAADGAVIPYKVPHVSIGQIEQDPGIPIGFWRSVSQSFNVFASECFMDELSHLAGKDPLDYRIQQLPTTSRHRGVLTLAAEKSAWGQSPASISQGIATSEPFHSYCAMVADITRTENGGYAIQRIVAAVDCGLVVNPDIAKSQIESGIVYALGAALKAPVTFKDGRCVQSNFHDLPVMRMDEIPEIEVYFIDSQEPPTGLGEIGVPAVAPAIANALFKASGQRQRELPLKLS